MPTPRYSLRRTTALALTMLMVAFAGCDSGGDDEPTPTTGTISGTITLPAGAGGDIVNTRVSLFTDMDDFDANSPTASATTDASGNFTFQNINPGSYFVAAWKDNNNSAQIDGGDFFGVIGTNQVEGFVPTRQQVIAGMNTGFNFTILILPTGINTVTGTYTGTSASTDAYTLSLTQSSGNVTGTGTVVSGGQTFSLAISGTYTPPSIALNLALQGGGTFPFTGTVSNGGSTIAGTVNFGGGVTDTVTLTRQ